MTTAPLAPGSISLRLYPHNELDATGVVDELIAQAAQGLAGGFDGIMLSEHHGGVGGYLPNPLQMSGFVLESTPSGWAAACPLLLPLRPTAGLAEDVAWLSVRHPGRVGLGVAAGGRALDFEAMGLDPTKAVPVFKAELASIVAMLSGRELRGLDEDRAFQHCRTNPIPVVSAAIATGAARRAAACGAGILLEGVSPVDKLARCCAAYDAAGGTGTKILIRRVWLGRADSDLIESQRRFYQQGSPTGQALPKDQTIATDDAGEMVERLQTLLTESGANALNLRLHLPGIPAGAIREQIAALTEQVVSRLRQRP